MKYSLNTMNFFKQYIAQQLQTTLSQLDIQVALSTIYQELTSPPDLELGHFAYPCFGLAKELQKAPHLIAEDLCRLIPVGEPIESVKNVQAYLNFFVSSKGMGEEIIKNIITEDYFNISIDEALPKTMIEFFQPNSHKELHVGHMRNLCQGDALVKLHEYVGYEMVSCTFPGDLGTHVAKCLWYLHHHNTDPVPLENKGAWLGKMYSKGHLKLEAEENEQEKEKNKQQLSEILTQLEQKQGEFYELWEETRKWSIALMEEVYQWADVTFDKWYWESEVDEDSLKLIHKYHKEGCFSESEGTIGIDLAEYDLGYCLLIKSDGHGLYATKDIELAKRKFDDYQIEKNIYVVDERQTHHFAQVFKVLEIMGFEHAEKCYHLGYNYVELPEGAMSSRKGNIVPIMDLISQMEAKVQLELEERYQDSWTKKETEKIASIIAKGAIKYGMLKIDVNKKIVFDMKEWLDLNGDSGPYLQYVYTRINSLCKKQGYHKNESINWEVLTELEEKKLLLKMANFNAVAQSACQHYKPNLLCNYLFTLAKAYNSFYNAHSINNAPNEAIKNARLTLSKAVGITMEKGLELLGIGVPEKM